MINKRFQWLNDEAKKKRTIIAVLLLPVFVVLSSLLYGIRVALFGAEAAEIETLMILWGFVMLVVGILLGVLFIFQAPQNSGYWQVILLSAVVGLISFMFLYPRLPENVLIYIAQPVKNPELAPPVRLLLIGGLDGLAFGAVIGLCTIVIDPHIKLASRTGLLRYCVLTILIAASILAGIAINEVGGFWDLAANFIPLASLLILKLAVMQWDKRHNQAQDMAERHA
jgi:hypothetical protein